MLKCNLCKSPHMQDNCQHVSYLCQHIQDNCQHEICLCQHTSVLARYLQLNVNMQLIFMNTR